MLTEIRLHGELGKQIGEIWKAQINSVSEGLRSVDINSKRKFFKYLVNKDKEGVKYQVLINGRDFEMGQFDKTKPESITKTELTMTNKSIKTIDIIPVIEGADDKLNIILGVILIVAAIFVPALAPIAFQVGLIGVGLVFAGVAGLLAQPPKFEDFRAGGKSSYLFIGPENVVGEGGPVPIVYGRLIVGSLAIAANYKNVYVSNDGTVIQLLDIPSSYTINAPNSDNTITPPIT